MTLHRGSRARFGRALGVAVVVAVLAVVGTSCEPAPPPGTSHSPSGSLDVLRIVTTVNEGGTYKSVLMEGWASDWDTLAPIEVMFYFIPEAPYSGFAYWLDVRLGDKYPSSGGGGPGIVLPPPDYTLTANRPRTDVDAAFHRGANFGFRIQTSDGVRQLEQGHVLRRSPERRPRRQHGARLPGVAGPAARFGWPAEMSRAASHVTYPLGIRRCRQRTR